MSRTFRLIILSFNDQILESVWNNPYEVFIDVTAGTSANEVPVEWVTNLLRGLPRAKVDNCSVIYHYNVNTPYRRQLRSIFRNAKHVGFEMEGRSRFLRGLDDVQTFMELSEVHLPETTGNVIRKEVLIVSFSGHAGGARIQSCMANSFKRETNGNLA
jgi:hypothetical protein